MCLCKLSSVRVCRLRTCTLWQWKRATVCIRNTLDYKFPELVSTCQAVPKYTSDRENKNLFDCVMLAKKRFVMSKSEKIRKVQIWTFEKNEER